MIPIRPSSRRTKREEILTSVFECILSYPFHIQRLHYKGNNNTKEAAKELAETSIGAKHACLRLGKDGNDENCSLDV